MHIPQSASAHPVFDRIPEENFECPLSRDLIANFQKQINALSGLSSNGKPNVGLIWPADPNREISMMTVNGVSRARYRLYTETYEGQREENGVIAVEYIDVDIVPPRFVIEQYDERGEMESGGYVEYSHLLSVAHHDERCCDGREATATGELCLGLYREPGERDLDDLKRRWQMREHLNIARPGEDASAAELAQSALDLKNWQQRVHESRIAAYTDAARQSFQTHGWKMFQDDPTARAWGKYHFTGGHNKSGTPNK